MGQRSLNCYTPLFVRQLNQRLKNRLRAAPMTVAESKLIQVFLTMLRGNVMKSPVNRPLELPEKRLHAVDMGLTARIFPGTVLHRPMNITMGFDRMIPGRFIAD